MREVGPHHDDQEGVKEQIWHHQAPEGVLHVDDVGVHQIGGHETAVEEHGEEQQEGEHAPAGQLPAAQGVGKEDAHEHVPGDAHGGDGHAHEVGPADGAPGGPQVLIGSQAELLGDQGIAVLDQARLGGEGAGDQQPEGHHAAEDQEDQQGVNEDVEGFALTNHVSSPPLEQGALLIDPGDQHVGGQDQHEAQQGLHEASGGGTAHVVELQQRPVHECIDGLRGGIQ